MRIDLSKYHIFYRIYILALVLLCIGVYHLAKPEDLLVYVPFFLPGGIKWAYLVGVCFILVGISFITNYYVKRTSYLLSFFLFFFVITVHVPNYLDAAVMDMRTFALINILKDTAIGAFALHIADGAHHQHLHYENTD
jgi:putative oxidoreductase